MVGGCGGGRCGEMIYGRSEGSPGGKGLVLWILRKGGGGKGGGGS